MGRGFGFGMMIGWVLGNLKIGPTVPLKQQELQTKVEHYLHPWKVEETKKVLTAVIVPDISSLYTGVLCARDDDWFWKGIENGCFTVKSAFEIYQERKDREAWCRNFIWKMKIPPRISHFLWLLCHSKILTNEHKIRRNLIDDPSCSLCGYQMEDLKRKVLQNMVTKPMSLQNNTTNFPYWLQQILKGDSILNGPIYMVFMLWNVWKVRCTWVFEGGKIQHESLVRMINELA